MQLPLLPCLLVTAVVFLPFTPARAAEDNDPAAVALADAVVRASGGDAWPAVKTVRWTFQVEDPAKPEPLLVAKHVWDVAANRDTVTWKGKTVTVDLSAPNTEGEAKEAFARWTNDSYWLLAPLKLRDRGVHLATGARQSVDGKDCDVLKVSFDKVGMTNNDQYTYYLDPATHLPVSWDYQPNPDKKINGKWEGYRKVGGLTLATEHSFGDKRLRMLDVTVAP